MKKNPTFAIHSFARRQTPESRFSHFAGAEEELLEVIAANFAQAKTGYREGVLLVTVPPEKFYSGVIEITEHTPLNARFERRRAGENAFITVTAAGEKTPAKHVELVLYSHELLRGDEDGPDTDADWELISINAWSTAEPEPQTPIAMARNFLGLAGGSKANYTAEEFARAIIYWATHCMREA